MEYYSNEKAIWTTRQIELINQKQFAKAVLDENNEAFVMHVNFWGLKIIIYIARKAEMVLWLAEKVIILAKYSDFADILLKKLANVHLEQTGVNKHTIKLEEGKQLHYKHIYNLGLVELETLKTYIKTNLANGFICALNMQVSASILFLCKSNNSFCLCVNYWELNNLIIEN